MFFMLFSFAHVMAVIISGVHFHFSVEIMMDFDGMPVKLDMM